MVLAPRELALRFEGVNDVLLGPLDGLVQRGNRGVAHRHRQLRRRLLPLLCALLEALLLAEVILLPRLGHVAEVLLSVQAQLLAGRLGACLCLLLLALQAGLARGSILFVLCLRAL